MTQRTANRIFVTNVGSVPNERLAKQGAKDVTVQYLIGEREGSDRFALRHYTVPKNGHTPLNQHEYEHHVFVLRGQGLLREGDQEDSHLRELREGDVVFVPSNAVHQFLNEHEEPFEFLCVKGNPAIYGDASFAVREGEPENSSRNYC